MSALSRLDVLVGRWTVRPQVDGAGTAWTEFAWTDDGLFLRQYTDADPPPPDAPPGWRDNAPFPTTALIGLDEQADEFSVLYADARGVHRVYRMRFEDGTWTQWRAAPGFHQRFTATVSGDVIEGRWERSDDGQAWALDFGLTFTRQSS